MKLYSPWGAILYAAKMHFRALLGVSVPTKMPRGARFWGPWGGSGIVAFGWGFGLRGSGGLAGCFLVGEVSGWLVFGWGDRGFGWFLGGGVRGLAGLGGFGGLWFGFFSLGGWVPRIATKGHLHCEYPKVP